MIFPSIKRSALNKRKLLGIAFILPAMIFVVFTKILPLIWNLIISFQEWNGMAGVKWVAFENYGKIPTDDILLLSFKNTLYIAFVSAAIAVIIGIVLAILIFQAGKKEGAVYRLVFYAPTMLPLTIVALLFVFIYNYDIGILNNVLRILGLGNLEHAWLAEKETVLPAICITNAWRLMGLTMMLCFTAISAIPSSLFEAVKIDGANYLKQVYYIILPIIMPIIELAISLTLISTFKTYDLVLVMTNGGPGYLSITTPIQMLEIAFKYNEFGYAAAISVAFSIVIMAFIIIVKRIMRGEVYEF